MTARLTLTFSHFEQLLKKGYSLDTIFLLKLIQKEKCNIKDMCSEDLKLAALYQGLVRKGCISEDCKILREGKLILEFLSTPIEQSVTLEKSKPITDDRFNLWWNTYPGTDNFVHKGKKFTGSRTLRLAKDDCLIKLNKILEEGEYTLELLIEALKFDVLQKKENSVKTNTNKLSYMQSSITYLNQRSFEPFIELIKEGAQVEESTEVASGGTNI
jgi:hypothetical protein